MTTSDARYGWNTDYSIHRLPGRTLIAVRGLRGNASFAARLQQTIRRWPGIRSARANHFSGRLLIRFDETLLGADVLYDRVQDECLSAGDSRRGWRMGSAIPLGNRTSASLNRLIRQALRSSQPKFSWTRLTGRRELRLFGNRVFRKGREMERRGERVVCLLKDGHPAGIVGISPSADSSSDGVSMIDKTKTLASESEVAATVEADISQPVWHTLSTPRVMSTLGSRSSGLSTDEARVRLAQIGPNRFPEPPRSSNLEEFLGQCKEPMALVLLASAGLSIVLGQWIDAAIITGIVIVNAFLAVFQNAKAQRALDELGSIRPLEAYALRDGDGTALPADQLVPGDVVRLESGDLVPADVRLLGDARLSTLESPITGESVDVVKDAEAVLDAGTGIGDRTNMAFMGTFVRQGRGHGVVVATGASTEMGRVAGLLDGADPGMTPLQRQLARVNRYVVFATLACGLVMIALGLSQGLPIGQLAITAISTAVAAIPEGLPITVSVALAAVASRMGRRKAVVRRLPAVETLGSTTVICTDKTGTLTQNRMSVRHIWAGDRLYAVRGEDDDSDGGFLPGKKLLHPDDDVAIALKTATLCSNASVVKQSNGRWSGKGDPMEAALLVAAARAGLVNEEGNVRDVRLHETPFDPEVRRMAVVCRDESGKVYAHVKGAPDALLDMCTHRQISGGVVPLGAKDREHIHARAERMAAGAERVLAVAYKPLSDTWDTLGDHDLCEGMTFVGLFGLVDPPRPEVRSSIQKCRDAGIKVIMTTGDHLTTAVAIAKEIGMMHENDLCLTGQEIDELDDARLTPMLERVIVCARVTPEQKLRIVRLLQAGGHVVAMTGDGVNDAPAVRAADIGVAMGRTGAEITRAAADMELLDDRFATIVHAVREGRGAFDNIRRTVRYTLATNIAEVVLMLGAMLVGVPLPLLPVHLLWLNLVCDGLPALALSFDHPAPDIMQRPPRRVDDGLFGGGLWARTATRGTVLGLGTLLLFTSVLGVGGVTLARSAALASLVAGKLLYLFEVRKRRALKSGPRNRFLGRAVGLSALLFLGTLYVPALQSIFGVTGLGMAHWVGLFVVLGFGMITEYVTGKRLPCASRKFVPA